MTRLRVALAAGWAVVAASAAAGSWAVVRAAELNASAIAASASGDLSQTEVSRLWERITAIQVWIEPAVLVAATGAIALLALHGLLHGMRRRDAAPAPELSPR